MCLHVWRSVWSRVGVGTNAMNCRQILDIIARDAPIKHWPIIGWLIIGA